MYACDAVGYVVDGTGKRIHKSKVEAILNWPRPQTGSDIKSFMGTINWPRSHLPHVAIVGAPLDQLRESSKFSWNETLETSFVGLKNLVAKSTSLIVENPLYPVLLGTDASNKGLGFWRGQCKPEFASQDPITLTQDQVDIIEYGSIAIRDGSLLYRAGITMRELAAVIFAVEKCFPHLQGRRFFLFTDHSALVHLFTGRDVTGKLSRWIDVLMTLEFTVIHWRGVDHSIADGLSRNALCVLNLEEIDGMADLHMQLNQLDSTEDVTRGKKSPTSPLERDTLIQKAHEMGHFGSSQIFQKLWHDGWWWKGIRNDLQRILGACEPCLRYNVITAGYHPLKPILASFPMQQTSADLICNVPKSTEGYQYMLVYICLFTRYIWVRPLRDKLASTIYKAITSIHLEFGNPDIISTDNGKEFKNRIASTISKVNDIDFRTISSYNSKGQGSVERANQDCSWILKKMCLETYEHWPEQIPHLEYYMNVRICSRTLTSPFVLMFGRQPKGLQSFSVSKHIVPNSIQEWVNHWTLMSDIVYPAIGEAVAKRQMERADSYNRAHRIVEELPVDALVMVKDVVRTSKWQLYYDGPFRIIRRNQGGAYLLKDKSGRQLPFRFPIDHLKPCPWAKEAIEKSYSIKAIIAHRGTGPTREYLVRWDESTFKDAWLHVDLFDSPTAFQTYHRKLQKGKQSVHWDDTNEIAPNPHCPRGRTPKVAARAEC